MLHKSVLFKSDTQLLMENGEHDMIEVEMLPKKVLDDKPVVMAVAILQNSKLLLLSFVYDVLGRYFVPGSFKLNYCDTDSLCLCKCIY